MTLDPRQAREALEAVDEILCHALAIKASPKRYLADIDTIARMLVGKWATSRPLVLEAAEDLAEIGAMAGRARARDAAARKRIAQLQADMEAAGQTLGADETHTLARALRSSYELGQAEIGNATAWQIAFDVPDLDALQNLTRSGVYWIGKHYGEALPQSEMLGIVEKVYAQGLGKTQAAALLKTQFGETFARSDSYWELLAGTMATRSRVHGQLSTLEVIGITEYEFVNPDDERTSRICRRLNGRIFTVRRAVEIRDAVVRAKTPDAVKAIAPWPREKDLVNRRGRELTDAELAAKGICMPPLHGHCRSHIDAVGYDEDIVEIDPAVEPPVSSPRPKKPKAKKKPK